MMYQDTESSNQRENIISNASLFESKQIRHNFIKKVYSLLSIQLLITVCIIALFAIHPGIHAWATARENQWFQLVAIVVALVILMVITCMGDLRRKHPHNLIALFAFTLAESLMLAGLTVMYNTTAILMAGGLTLVICLGLTLFALQTKYDFTTKSGIMIVILLVATLIMLLGIFFRSHVFMLVMSGIMATIMGIFLVIDTQMIIGGTHSVQMSPEEYIFAAINLYLDIINMFIYILAFMGRDS